MEPVERVTKIVASTQICRIILKMEFQINKMYIQKKLEKCVFRKCCDV